MQRLASLWSLCSNRSDPYGRASARRTTYRVAITSGRSHEQRTSVAGQLPARRAGRDRRRRIPVDRLGARSRRCEKYPRPPAFANLGKTLTYADIDRLSQQFAAYLLGELKLKKGDRVAIMMPNVPAVPDRDLRRAARRPDRGQHQSDVHRARAQAPAGRLRRDARSSCSTTSAHTVQEVLARHRRSSRSITTGLGDMLGFPKGAIVNFVLQAREEDGAGLRHPRRDPLPRRARRSAQMHNAAGGRRSTPRTSPSCSTPAAPPAWPRARC